MTEKRIEVAPRNLSLLLAIILFLIVLGMLLYVSVLLLKEGYQCMQNPLVFGAGKLKESNNAEFMCTCTLGKPNSPTITFDSTGLEVVKETGSRFKPVNFTELDKLIPKP